MAEWISDIVRKTISPPLCESLADGVALCRLIERVGGTRIRGVHTDIKFDPQQGLAKSGRARMFATENVGLFLKACNGIHIHSQDLFSPSQLFEGDAHAVMHCLLAMVRVAHIRGVLISDELMSLANVERNISPQEAHPLLRAPKPYDQRRSWREWGYLTLAVIFIVAGQLTIAMAFVQGSLQTVTIKGIGSYHFGFSQLTYTPFVDPKAKAKASQRLASVAPEPKYYRELAEAHESLARLYIIGIIIGVFLGVACILLLASSVIEIALIRCPLQNSRTVTYVPTWLPIAASSLIVVGAGVWSMAGVRECKMYVRELGRAGEMRVRPGIAFWLAVVASGLSLVAGVIMGRHEKRNRTYSKYPSIDQKFA
uniref:Calponin-homology (CH) domain-containing protein n=1 Tax=Amorphochlora amoebiformis TaxID=1561963 RepID=A0A7S0GTU6_9EUKA